MKKIFYGLTAALMLFAATSCVNDLNVESIDPNQSSELDVDGLFSKIYNTLGTTGQKGPDGNGDISGLDEGTSAFYRMMWNLNELPADMVYWIWPDPGYDDLRKAGYEVIGVSVDGEKSHQKFIEKNNLPFTLIADTDKKLVEQFGVWGEKSMYGRKYMGTFRTTFIINEEGIIERIISPKEVKTKEHAAQVLGTR